MAILRTAIKISNPLLEDMEPVIAVCVVNRSLFRQFIISKEIAEKLELKEVQKRQEKIGDSPEEIYSYVGPIKIDFNGRIGFSGALINNIDENKSCYLGSITMDDMNLVIFNEPKIELGFNPKSVIVK